MGYRNYIGTINKETYHKVKSMTKEECLEFCGDDPDDYYPSIDNHYKQIYELGKYCEFDLSPLRPFFENNELQRIIDEDTELMIGDKEFLISLIKCYEGKVEDLYTNLMDHPEKHSEHIKMINLEWNVIGHISLTDNKPITYSCRYEYSIFELIHLLKTVDWENNYLIYYGC